MNFNLDAIKLKIFLPNIDQREKYDYAKLYCNYYIIKNIVRTREYFKQSISYIRINFSKR